MLLNGFVSSGLLLLYALGWSVTLREGRPMNLKRCCVGSHDLHSVGLDGGGRRADGAGLRRRVRSEIAFQTAVGVRGRNRDRHGEHNYDRGACGYASFTQDNLLSP